MPIRSMKSPGSTKRVTSQITKRSVLEIGPHQLLHMRALHLHRDHLPALGEDTLVHLAQ